MSLTFYFGPSGAGKSRFLYREIIERSLKEPDRTFLILVPDQFTMQTQKDLVTLHDRGGIMNIDVLSFGRLAHRVLDEVGGREVPVLDDTGKSLVLQKVAASMKGELPALGGSLHRQGYIHEVKSAVSEFMQYGIAPDDVAKLIDFTGKRGALTQKLKDLEKLYRGFLDYINGSFVTTEETLDVLRRSLAKSRLLRGCVAAFDGFTGFTPIQNRVIQEIMTLASETIVTVTMGAGENPYEPGGEQQLFHLSRKTVCDLEQLAGKAEVGRGTDVFILPGGEKADGGKGSRGTAAPGSGLGAAGVREGNPEKADIPGSDAGAEGVREGNPEKADIPGNGAGAEGVRGGNPEKADIPGSGAGAEGVREGSPEKTAGPKLRFVYNPRHRFAENPALMSLERNLFRYPARPYVEAQDNVRLFEADTPREEVRQAGLQILELIRTEGLAYRDIAVITGDLEGYAPYVETEFAQLDIPCYIDRTRGIVLNPMTEFIKSALGLYLKDFSYESVFHYLRCGLADITPEETDELENYILKTGIRGYRRWSRLFTRRTREMGEDEASLIRLNEIRERMMAQVESLSLRDSDKVSDYVEHLYDFLVDNKVQRKLADFEHIFTEDNQLSRAREYAQIYRLVMNLLDQIYALLGDEVIGLREFSDILGAGFGEIQVGTIPQNVDRIVVGDMERTRLRQVKALFFLGVNDGNIPKSASRGGIISDLDREFLRESGMELSPTPRQQMFIQRLYLYLNLTKPSRYLRLSFCRVNSEGKSIRPAYLTEVMTGLFPSLAVEFPQGRPALDQVATPGEGLMYLAEGLRLYAEGAAGADGKDFFTLYAAYGGLPEYREKRELLAKAAFRRYHDTGLSGLVARALYGVNLENSVSRLETYAACAYRHFLQYGLSLEEREEFGFEAVDMGNVFHAVLEQFGAKLEEEGYTWFDFPQEFGEKGVSAALEGYAAQYGEAVLFSSARSEYAITRMGRILTRTVLTLQSQLKCGEFKPDACEVSFHYADELSGVNVALSEEQKLRLRGRIDRIDIAQDEDRVYVKVIDYKSGSRQFDLAALYYGLQLQLVVYMNAALELEARKYPGKEIVPAALLYYHIDDPTVETPVELTDEEINSQILGKLRMNGVVNGEEAIVSKLDRVMENKSWIYPLERKKDGSFSARSSVMSGEELKILSDYVSVKVREIGREILDGKVSLNPYEKGNTDACAYCAYRRVCGFDPAIPGYGKRVLENLDKAEALERMEEAGR